jgi:hypothetical protein
MFISTFMAAMAALDGCIVCKLRPRAYFTCIHLVMIQNNIG